MSTDVSTDAELSQMPLAYSAEQLGKKLGVSLRHVRRLNSSGLLPRPVRLGRSVRWGADEFHAWLLAGAPPRDRWEKERKHSGRDGR